MLSLRLGLGSLALVSLSQVSLRLQAYGGTYGLAPLNSASYPQHIGLSLSNSIVSIVLAYGLIIAAISPIISLEL